MLNRPKSAIDTFQAFFCLSGRDGTERPTVPPQGLKYRRLTDNNATQQRWIGWWSCSSAQADGQFHSRIMTTYGGCYSSIRSEPSLRVVFSIQQHSQASNQNAKTNDGALCCGGADGTLALQCWLESCCSLKLEICMYLRRVHHDESVDGGC